MVDFYYELYRLNAKYHYYCIKIFKYWQIFKGQCLIQTMAGGILLHPIQANIYK